MNNRKLLFSQDKIEDMEIAYLLVPIQNDLVNLLPANKHYDGYSKMLLPEIILLYQKDFSKKEEEHAKLSIS